MMMIKCTCTACPVQFEGVLANGKTFYFRARWGGWRLGVGDGLDCAVAGIDFDHYEDWGDGFDAGWMETETALAFIQHALRLYAEQL